MLGIQQRVFQLLYQGRHNMGRGAPNNGQINFKILVYDEVLESYYLLPLNVRVLFFQLIRHVVCCLINGDKLPCHDVLQAFIV